jgi:transposase
MEESSMNKKYVVRLTEVEREGLERLVSKDKGETHRIKHANILLMTDRNGPSRSDEQAAKALACHANTVRNVRQRLVEEGLEAALERKKQERPSRMKILDGKKEARLIAVSCGKPPAGRARWTVRLLADKLVELEIVESISAASVCRTLKKRTAAASAQVLGGSARAEWKVRRKDGRRFGRLPAELRRGVSGRAHG